MATFTPVASPADIAAVDNLLKEVYPSDELEKQFYDEFEILDLFEETTEYTDSVGDRAILFLRTGRTGGISARAIGEKLLPPNHQKSRRVEYDYTNHYLQIGVHGPVVARMKTDRQAAVREIDDEITRGLEDQRRDWVRQLHGSGDAVIASGLPGGGASTTVLLGADNYWAIERGFLYAGMHVDIGTAANPVLDTGGNKVMSIVDDPAAPAIVVENSTATTAASAVSIAGNRNVDLAQRELNGLGNIFGETTFGNLNPATAGNEAWKAQIEDNSGVTRDLSISLMTTLLRKLRSKGKYPDFLIGDLVQEQRYYELLEGHVRFAGESNLTAGNTEGLAFAKIKSGFVGDPDCKPGKIWMGRRDAICRFSAGPVAWQNAHSGGGILHWLPDYDMFQARAAKYWQIGCKRRNILGVLSDLTKT